MTEPTPIPDEQPDPPAEPDPHAAPEPAGGWQDVDAPTTDVDGGDLRPGDRVVMTMTPTVIDTISDPDDMGQRHAVFTDGRRLPFAIGMAVPVAERGPE